jgi:MFS family permease
LAGAFGALAAAVPMVIAHWLNVNVRSVERSGFLFYSGVAIVIAIIYRGLPRGYVAAVKARRRMRPRRIVLELSALFSLDAAAGGLVVQSLLVLWLHLRFDLSIGATAAVFFATGVLGALSQLLSGPLAKRIGLIRTMAFTHMPASALLALAAFMPNAGLAITLLLIRSLFSSMDVPARQSFVMAVVPPEERAAAAGITNVPRSLASAATPLAAGALLAKSTFGWPLLLAGLGKFTYDALLLLLYRETAEAVVD